MATTATRAKKFANIAELIRDLGGVSTARVRLQPPPGRATIDDLIRINDRQDLIFELVDGTLVEKVMGAAEGFLAQMLGYFLNLYVVPRHAGFVLGPDSTLQIMPRLVRAPDISFVRRAKCPGGKFPLTPVPELVPDLAIEVLSKSNRPGEMKRKLKEYFLSGVTVVWFIYPEKRMARVYSAPEHFIELTKSQALDGGDVLPGFRLPLAELFAELEELPAKSERNGNRKRP